MDNGKTKEELLRALIEMHKDIERKVESQERFIAGFRLLAQHEGLFSQVIDNLPFPVAVFEQNGVVRVANGMLIRKAQIAAEELSEGRINLLDRVTDENYGVFEAAEDAFAGETTLVKELVFPLALFCREGINEASDPYRRAVFFPVPGGEIRYGAVMLME